MEYLLILLEGIASFISPCVLPMIPIYIVYFTGEEEKNLRKAVINSIGFVLGFTVIFLLLSVFASTFGNIVSKNMQYFKIGFGILIIIFGFNYMEVFKIKFLNKMQNIKMNIEKLNFLKATLLGIVFGEFLGSALLLIAKNQDIVKGITLIIIYSIGLGIPFIISTILIEKLKTLFTFIKKHYSIIKKISGLLLIIMGIYTIFF